MFLTLPQQKVFFSPEFKSELSSIYFWEVYYYTFFSEISNQNHNKLSPYILKDVYYLKRKMISADKVLGKLEPLYTAVRV